MQAELHGMHDGHIDHGSRSGAIAIYRDIARCYEVSWIFNDCIVRGPRA